MFKIFLICKQLKTVQNSFLREVVISYPSDLLECCFYRPGQYLVIQTVPSVPLAQKGNGDKILDLVDFV